MSDLNIVFPTSKIITLSGEDVEIKPFTFGQLPKVMGLISKLSEPASKIQGLDVGSITQLFSEYGSDIIEVLAFCLGKPVTFIEELSQDEGILLVTAFLEVNGDFFMKKVLQTMKNQITTAAQRKLKAGDK